ncbi:MAG: UDP-N-acetylmuramoyl-tripeptide--D-alanyl-D-alanine ligase [Ilumatobacteraceae bacterium]
MRILASDAAAAVGGRLIGSDVEFDGASFDSRSTRSGELFVPIVAERDGHDFIGQALAAGAVAFLTSQRAKAGRDSTAIEVADTSAALMALARWARRRSAARVVGVTGSVGKTSTKDLIAAACAATRRTTANERSFNNEQGLPVTILDAPDDTEVLVLEMGMRGFGEITRLCDVASPDIGVVTTVGHSHTERVGGIDGVAVAKRELVEALPASGTAVLNADDERVMAMAAHTGAGVLTYGRAGDVRVIDLALDELARPRFTIDTPWGSSHVALATSGAHMAMNAAAAVAVAGALGVPLEAAVAGLATASVSAMRMQVTVLPTGATIINDAYNANPTSMAAAVDALTAMQATRRIAVLGLMAELDDPATAHREIASMVARSGIELIAVGTDRYGVAPSVDPITDLGDLGPGDVVLVKASRAAGLDRIADQLSTFASGFPGTGAQKS